MAERALIAFGRYLRTLRERKGLSLEEAITLTRAYPSPLSKSYLSRLENGATRAGFEKIVAIARAYGVPVDVLAERLWLDLELEKNDPPETEGMNFQKLTAQAYRSSSAGWKWRSYAFARDGVMEATAGQVGSSFADRAEQVATATQNCATAATTLGAFQFALWEYRVVEGMNALSARKLPSFLVSFAILHRRRHELPLARTLANRAIEACKAAGAEDYLGYAYGTRALIDREEGNFAACLEMYELALSAYKAAGQDAECASVRHSIGQAFVELGRLSAARRSFAAAERIATRLDLHDVRIRIRLSLGEIARKEGNAEAASRHWFEAATIARRTRDKTLLFMSEFRLLRQAVELGRHAFAQSLARRLQRLTPWVMPSTEEVGEFGTLVREHDLLRRRSVRSVSS